LIAAPESGSFPRFALQLGVWEEPFVIFTPHLFNLVASGSQLAADER
jgi:hypothetical protein